MLVMVAVVAMILTMAVPHASAMVKGAADGHGLLAADSTDMHRLPDGADVRTTDWQTLKWYADSDMKSAVYKVPSSELGVLSSDQSLLTSAATGYHFTASPKWERVHALLGVDVPVSAAAPPGNNGLSAPLPAGLDKYSVLIGLGVTMCIGLFKNNLLSKIPDRFLPIVAIALGTLADLGVNYYSGHTGPPWAGALAGVLGVGLREVKETVIKAEKPLEAS